MFTVTNNDPDYVFPLVGNGEVVTMLGPNGYHTPHIAADPRFVNHHLFWAGRRLDTPTHALVRFGQVTRVLQINNMSASDEQWEQTMDYDRGMLITTIIHGTVREQTFSRVCLTANLLVFHTRLENTGSQPVDIDFTAAYHMETEVPEYLCFPVASHFDSRPGYTPDKTQDILLRVHAAPDHSSLLARYQIGDQLGEVRVGWHPVGEIIEQEGGGEFHHRVTLNAAESTGFWFWIMLSDRLKYSHFPDFRRLQHLMAEHERVWAEYWRTSSVELGNERLEGLRKSSLYAIRCNASPWSIPPAYLASTWEGRTFHDELYPFLGLLSGGYDDLAARVPHFRLRTLPVAQQRSGYHGAHFPWETLENGQEGAPFGHWLDERFHVGQFSETAWRYYLYTRDLSDLERFYPLLRECAELFVHDVLVRDQNSVLKTRLVTDFDEQVFPLSNGIFTICAAVRSLENAARAAVILDVEAQRREVWRDMALELRDALPWDRERGYYKVSDDAVHWHIAQVGMIYPFVVDMNSARAHETLTRLAAALRTNRNATAGTPESYEGTHWMWATAMLATAFFFQGRAEEGYALLCRAPNSAGPFLSPTEQYREVEPVGYMAPWFTTSSGALLYAVHSMFVQVHEDGTRLLPALPSDLNHARFTNLLATHRVRVSGEVRAGSLVALEVATQYMLNWHFLVPERHVSSSMFASGTRITRPDDQGWVTVECVLAKGTTKLI